MTPVETLKVRGQRVMWAVNCVPGVGESRVTLRNATINHRVTYHDSADCEPVDQVRSEVDYHDGHVIWLDGQGRVIRKFSRLSSPELIALAEDISNMVGWSSLSVGGDYVFWHEEANELGTQAKVFRAAIENGTRELVANFSGEGVEQVLAISSSYMVVRTGDRKLYVVERILNLFGDYVWNRHHLASDVTAMAVDEASVDGRRIWWVQQPLGASYQIKSAPQFSLIALPPATDVQTRHTSGNATYQVRADLAVRGGNLFWHEQRSGTLGPLVRLRRGEVAPEEITSVLQATDRLFLSAGTDKLFWTHSDPNIRMIDQEADAVRLDVSAMELQVTQVLQSGGHNVPLIYGKPTLVRVFAQVESDPAGLGAVQPGAALRGRIPGGAPLPGSPLQPLNPNADVDAAFGPRLDLDGSFRFELPESWTWQGPIELWAEVNPVGLYPETERGNNTVTRSVDFVRKAPIVVSMYPVRLPEGTRRFDQYEPWFQRMFDRCDTLLPTSGLWFVWKDFLMEKPILPPLVWGDYQFGGRNQTPPIDNDAWMLLTMLQAAWFFDRAQLEIASLRNARLHTGAMIPFEHRNWGTANGNTLGMALPALNALVFQEDAAWVRGDPFTPVGGFTLAHALGHNHDRGHVCGIGAPDIPIDGAYPYGCNFSGGAHLGWDPMGNSLIDFNVAGDLMSFRSTTWISDYTYQGIFNGIGIMPPGSFTTGGLGGGGGGGGGGGTGGGVPAGIDLMLFIGGVDPYSGEMIMLRPYPLGESESAFLRDHLVRNENQTNEFAVCGYGPLLTGGEGLYWEYPMLSFPVSDGDGTTVLAGTPITPGITRYAIKNATSGEVVHEVTAGLAVPTVTITGPAPYELAAFPFMASWEGHDADGDDLTYLVRYSHNDGMTWTVVATDTPRTSIEMDVSGRLPGGINCRIMVTVNDGLHTSSAISEPFTVANKPPAAHFSFSTDRTGRVGGVSHFVAPAGEPITLHAYAQDPEEGLLEGDYTVWSYDGPVAGSFSDPAAGPHPSWQLPLLPSGTYTLQLLVRDSLGETATATALLTVLPKYIAISENSAVLDGWGGDSLYGEDACPILRRYDDGSTFMARMVHAQGRLHVSLTGLPYGGTADEAVAIAFDVDHSDSAITTASHRLFVVRADGSLAIGIGNGSGFTETAPAGLDAALVRDGAYWQVELIIDDSALVGFDGRTVRMAIAHLNRTATGDDTVWPLGAALNQPNTWNDVVLAEHPDDAHDLDNDDIDDVWELQHFGNLSRDGSGDADGDGITDGEEFLQGENPNHADFGPVLDEVRFDATSEVVQLRWIAEEGRVYQVWRGADLIHWESVGDPIPGDGMEAVFADEEPLPGQGYYKVSSSPQ